MPSPTSNPHPSPTSPRLQLLPSVAKRVRDPSGVALEIQALEAAALAKVGGRTKVIVMDEKVGPGPMPVVGAMKLGAEAGD